MEINRKNKLLIELGIAASILLVKLFTIQILQDVQPYFIQFQGFTQDLMMLIGNLMKFKLRVPSFMKKAIYTMTEKTVDDIFNKNDFSDPGVLKTVVAIREYSRRLGYSQAWTTAFVYKVVMLAKKEPKPDEKDEKAGK